MDVTLRLDRGIPDVPWARHELLAVMRHEDIAIDPDRVGLVVTELLTNALLHGSEPVEVHASTSPDCLRIEVHDSGETVPHARRPEPTDVNGRGLMLVAGLVERWGVDQSGDGKLVWAEFPVDGSIAATFAATRGHRDEIQLPDSTTTSSGHRSSAAQGALNTAWV